ncbi:MAG TPA: DUF4349 domain-containing protein, partial [Terriglobia bacterium]|nr:DUF4349 domain-containing protein [Terriglobia bacterium]
MSRNDHPFSPEELMAYTDGQLLSDRAELVTAHVAVCPECAESVASFKVLSKEARNWEIEASPVTLTNAVTAELRHYRDERRRSERQATWWGRNRLWAYGLTVSLATVCLAVVLSPSLMRSRGSFGAMEFFDYHNTAERLADPAAVTRGDKAAQDGGFDNAAVKIPLGSGEQSGPANQSGQGAVVRESRKPSPPESPSAGQAAVSGVGPMIIRTVHVDIMTKDFERARPAIEDITRKTGGYIEQLQTRGETGSGRSLSATLRLPVDRLDSGLEDIRHIGQVRNESQSNSDVSSQYIDLNARLNNAHNTEQRLITLLRE